MKSVCSPILMTAPSRNLSKRKDVEKHLVQMEGRYRGLLEAAPDAVTNDFWMTKVKLPQQTRSGLA